MSTPILPFAVWEAGTNQASIPANDNALRSEILAGRVISKTTTAQPVGVDGAIYIIPAGATGSQWGGFTAGDLALFRGGTWYAYAPVQGVVARFDGSLEQWDGGAWVAISGGGDFENPMTSAGDMIVGGTDGDPMRLPAGATGDVLQMVAGQPTWGPSSGGGSGIEAPFTAPPQSGWSWVNQGTSTLVDNASEQVLIGGPTGSGANLVARARSAPATPYTATARIRAISPAKIYMSAGIGLRNSTTGRIITFDLLASPAGATFRVAKFNTSVSFNSEYTSITFPYFSDLWLRISDDGTNIKFFWSSDGIYWTEFYSVGRTDFMTPDQLIFLAGTENSATPNFAPIVRLLSWKID